MASAVAGALWVLAGALRFAFAQTTSPWSRLAGIVPATAPAYTWGTPGSWPLVTVLLGALGVAAWYLLLVVLARRRDAASVGLVLGWFAAVAAGAIVGIAIDAISVIADFPIVGLLAFTSQLGQAAAAGAFWGLVTGWMPALIVARAPAVAGARAARLRIAVAATAVAALALFVGAGVLGQRAGRVASAQAAAVSEGADPAQGGLPDPYAEGDPVPTAAPASGPLDPAWCTPDKATPLRGELSAATGHRVLPVQLMNFSDEPCVIEGYLDVAFADRNGHELAVTVAPGSSFMAADPGPQRIEVPAGGYAVAYLGWDAAATAGALVATTLYVAPTAGIVRGSWPVEVDIVEGSKVEITAWQLQAGPISGG